MDKITVIVEKAEDGTFWCHTSDALNGHICLTGCGETVAEAKADLHDCLQEARDDARNHGEAIGEVEFEWTYDLESFFNYFSFLNISAIAQLAGINPSLMRQYASGAKKAGEKTYKRLSACVDNIAKELAAASF